MIKRVFFLALLLAVFTAGWARPIKGVVRSGNEKLAGVVVTDGYRFTATDKKGRFSLEIDPQAQFISIVTPSGYICPYESGSPVFYRKIESGTDYNFNLIPYGNKEGYVLFAVADPQTGNDNHFKRFEAETVADLRKHSAEHSVKGRAMLGLMLGDIVWDNLPLLQDYKKSMAGLGFPVYPVIGNHDYDMNAQGDDAAAWAYRAQFGPEYYGFNSGNEYFIVLDNIVYDT
ncbi:MAG: hypothetical protein LUD68_05210 [Rikenellaceae bacterium]|nr:hypothetical protein [Rikenellaceae bacterium]